MEEKKKNSVSNDSVSLPDEAIQKVYGGGFGDDIPRTPEYPIDDDAKQKFN